MWAPVRGRCSHACTYCYMKRYAHEPVHFDHKELCASLGKDRYIFVCHTCDLFAADIPYETKDIVIRRTRSYPDNWYLFQSKNPAGFVPFADVFPNNTVLATTIETNRTCYALSRAPIPEARAAVLGTLADRFFTMVTIEPIVEFDMDQMIALIKVARPSWVTVGADSKRHNLPEPSPDKIDELVATLVDKLDIPIVIKDNLTRLRGGDGQ